MEHDIKPHLPLPPPASPAAIRPKPLYRQIRRRLPAWRKAGASPRVLQWLREGARCEWLKGPPPPFHMGVSCGGPTGLKPAESLFLKREYARLMEAGAWETAPPSERTHVSRVHLVPKKVPPGEPPKWRVVIDLRPTNAY